MNHTCLADFKLLRNLGLIMLHTNCLRYHLSLLHYFGYPIINNHCCRSLLVVIITDLHNLRRPYNNHFLVLLLILSALSAPLRLSRCSFLYLIRFFFFRYFLDFLIIYFWNNYSFYEIVEPKAISGWSVLIDRRFLLNHLWQWLQEKLFEFKCLALMTKWWGLEFGTDLSMVEYNASYPMSPY